MDIIRFFIRPVKNEFAIIVTTSSRGEVIVDRGAKPVIKGKFLHYVRYRDALQTRLKEVA
jgi:hypothetical protein